MTSTTATPPRLPRVRAAGSIAASLYLAVHLCMAAWIAVPVLALGWSPDVATGDGMRPSLRPGDVVLVDRRTTADVPVGALVVLDGRHVDGRDTVRRVAEVTRDGGLRTKGDADVRVDERVARPDEVGVGRLLVPLVGTPAMWWATGDVVAFTAWAASVVVAVAGSRRPRAWRAPAP